MSVTEDCEYMIKSPSDVESLIKTDSDINIILPHMGKRRYVDCPRPDINAII